MSKHECVTNCEGDCVCIIVDIVKGQLKQLASLAGELAALDVATSVLEHPSKGVQHHINVTIDEIVDDAETLASFVSKYQKNKRGERIGKRLDKLIRKARDIQTS